MSTDLHGWEFMVLELNIFIQCAYTHHRLPRKQIKSVTIVFEHDACVATKVDGR